MKVNKVNTVSEDNYEKEGLNNAYGLFLILILLILSEDVLISIKSLFATDHETKILPTEKPEKK